MEQKEQKTVKPEVLGGFRDMLPKEALQMQWVVDRVRKVYESFGFLPLETPGMERLDVLTGGNAVNKSIYVAQIIRGTEDKNVAESELTSDNSALRFDLTVSLARIIAANPDLVKPFKRYQLGKVWRGEKPQAGRFREFFQLDFDIVGSRSLNSDIETIQIMYECLRSLGIKDFTIKFNSRKILNGLAQAVGISGDDKIKEVFRIIDKLDKIGAQGVKQELMRQPDNQYDESALAMSEADAEKILAFLAIKGDQPEDILSQLDVFFAGTASDGQEGLAQLRGIANALDAMAMPRRNWRIDLSVARGLDYYTGPVFEATLDGLPELGSIFGGGRFDGLTNRFMSDSNIAGVGASVGVDRLLVGLNKLGLIEEKESLTKALVTIFDQKFEQESMALANDLRQNYGINTELYLGDDRTLRAQFSYATKKAIPFVIVLGEDEINSGHITLKDMAARKQETLTKDEIIARLSA